MTTRADDDRARGVVLTTRKRSFDLDIAKLLLVGLLLVGGVYANWYFRDQSVLYRALALIALAGACAAIAVNTAAGRSVWSLVKEARVEIRRVVFPSLDETTQTTLIVVAVVVVIALVLWVLDLAFGAIISNLIG